LVRPLLAAGAHDDSSTNGICKGGDNAANDDANANTADNTDADADAYNDHDSLVIRMGVRTMMMTTVMPMMKMAMRVRLMMMMIVVMRRIMIMMLLMMMMPRECLLLMCLCDWLRFASVWFAFHVLYCQQRIGSHWS